MNIDVVLYCIEKNEIIDAVLEFGRITEWYWNEKFKGLNDLKRIVISADIKLNEGYILLGQL